MIDRALTNSTITKSSGAEAWLLTLVLDSLSAESLVSVLDPSFFPPGTPLRGSVLVGSALSFSSGLFCCKRDRKGISSVSRDLSLLNCCTKAPTLCTSFPVNGFSGAL